MDSSEESPPYSRLFIICERQVTSDQLQEVFSPFGIIEDIRMPRDRDTNLPKGVAYIKFSKTSEAANALEQMNKKVITNTKRPLKVLTAANRSDIQHDDDYDDEKCKKLFIMIPKTATEETLEQHFNQFGQVVFIHVHRHWQTGEVRGGAFIKYRKFSEAAYAFEQCSRNYRPVFAQPKGYKKRRLETKFQTDMSNLATSANLTVNSSLLSVMNTRPDGYTRVNFMCSPYLNYNQVQRIFDIVPGMLNCQFVIDLLLSCGKGHVSYSNPVSAAYAVEKLHNFEYPPGCRIFVRPDNSTFYSHEQYFPDIPNTLKNLKSAVSSTQNSSTPDLAKLAAAIAEASKVIKIATVGVTGHIMPDSDDLNYCSVKLPPTKPLANIDSVVVKRCFLVCKPQPPALAVLKDIFCRFGDLVDVYTLPNKIIGFARYATAEAADEAIKVLHGAEVCGVRIKVLEADSEAPPKKTRYT